MSRLRRLLLAVPLTAALLAGGCVVPVVAPAEEPGGDGVRVPPPAAAPGTAAWRPCPEVPEEVIGRGASGMTYECATVTVPQDWSAPPGGATYEIALLRARARDQRDRIGSLLVNPGGPGASGVDTAVYLSFGAALGGLPADVTRRFDIVGFDPRGVGRSSPVECISDADQDASFAADPDPVSQAEFDRVADLQERIAARCGTAYAGRLQTYSTEQAAHDMEAIRTAVGDEKLTYLGYSYGTLLGATYAQLYPRNIRALVLDGAIDPAQGPVAGAERQAQGFERAFTNFAAWCASTPGRCPVAPDARAALTAALAAAERAPVRASDGRLVTSGWVFYGVVASLYVQDSWRPLAVALADLARGDGDGILALADAYADRDEKGQYTNMFDANLVVNCADAPAGVTAAEVRRLQAEWRATYPLFGAPLAVGMLPCVFWPGERDPYPTGAAEGAPPILVVGTTGDPATPYENTQKLADMLGTGQVLTWEGEGHTAYADTPCITAAVNAYLIDLVVPRPGLRCPAR